MWKTLLTFLLKTLGQAALEKGVETLAKKDVDTPSPR